MGVVDLHGDLFGQEIEPGAEAALEVLDGVLQSGAGEEVMLDQAQALALGMVVLGIEHLADDVGQIALQRLVVIAAGEGAEVQSLPGAAGAPHAQGVDGVAVVAGDGHIIRHGQHLMGVAHLKIGATVHLVGFHAAAEMHLHGVVGGGHFPGVAVFQPVIGHFHLLAVHDALAEQAILIADGAAHGGHIQGGQAVHETGRQTAQAAVAQAGLRLLTEDAAPADAQLQQGFAHVVHAAQVDGVAVQAAARQKFHGQIIQALAHVGLVLFAGGHPLLHDLIADGGGHGLINLLIRGVGQGAAAVSLNFTQDRLLDRFLIKRRSRHKIPPKR